MNPSIINEYLLGQHADWYAFTLYIIACLMIAVIIWGLVSLFTDRYADPAMQRIEIERGLTWAMLIVGIIAVVYGAIIILRI